MKYLCILATCLLLTSWIPSSSGQAVSKEKKFSGRFPASKGELQIDNRYGKLEINTWDRNEVTVDITVKVKASSAACAQEMLDRVRIQEPEESSNSIAYKTIIDSRSCGTNMNELNVDYVINMPRRHRATFVNKYGDVKIADVEGKVDIEVKYGKLTAGTFKGTDNDLVLGYGGATISGMEGGTISSSYSNLSVGKAGSIKVANKYGKSNIGTVRTLEIEQKYGDLDIGTVDALRCSIQFAGFSVDRLQKSVQLNIKYGSKAKFDYVGPEVDNIMVNASYSNLNFHFDKNVSLSGELSLSYGNVRNGASSVALTSYGEDKPGRSSNYSLKAGSGKGRFLLNGSYGNIAFE